MNFLRLCVGHCQRVTSTLLPSAALTFFAIATSLSAATVSWDGGGGNNSWQTAANWSGNVVPGPNDDVVIDVAGDITVVHNSGTTQIRSLNSQEGFQLLGGSLTLTAGASTVAGPLRLAVGSLMVRGAGTTFLTSGSVTNEDVTLSAAQGGSLSLPGLQRLVRTIGGDWRISADGTNSVVNLAGLTQASVADFYQLTLTVANGGRINVPALTQVNALDATAEGGGSTIDLAGLSGLVRNTTAGTSRFEASSGGRILAPNVTAFDRVEIYLRNTGQIQTAPLTAVTGGHLLLDGCTNSFPNVTNLIGNNLTVEAGAKLMLPAVTRLARTNAGTLLVRAWDPTSMIDLPNVTNGVVEPFYRLRLEAADGGRIQLPKLAGVDGAIDAFADGPGSVVDLPGVIGRFSNPKAGNAYLEAAAGGAIYITNVTELDRIDVTLNDSGLITLGKVRSFTGALMSLYAATNSFPGITNAEASNFEVDDRARLTLPGLTRLERKIAGDIILTSRDNGVLEFPNVTSAQTLTAYQLEAWASTGGRIYLPQLVTTDGALIINANGSNSLVSLTGLSGLLANVTGGPAALEVADGGVIAIPNVTRLDRVDFTLRNGGQITRNQITAIANAKITIAGPNTGFPLLGDLGGIGVALEDGAMLSLPLVTQLVRTNTGPLTLRADNASVLDLPNVTSAAVQPFYQLDLLAYDGSRIQLPRLSAITGALDVLADGTNSVVDLSGLQGVLTTTQAGQSYVEVTSGGAVLMPGVTGFDLVTLTIEGSGQFPTAQLTTLTRSVVTIDGTVAAFPNLGDATGTTFKYENGGTAAFQPPADFVVSNISVPATALANQPVAMAWDVTNIGTTLTNGTWSDALYLSADALPGNDVFVGSVNSSGSFPSGVTRRFTNNVILPAKFGGIWRVVVVANQSRTVFEGTNFFNNTNLSAASIEVQAPDLIVSSATLSTSSAQFGQSVDVTWTVRNAGTAPTTGNWSDRLLLVTNLNSLNQGITLLNRAATETLAPNSTYTRTSTVALPLSPNAKGGSYFIVAYTDINGGLAESKETNNTASAALTLSLPPMPDLAVANLTAPTNALPGQTVTLNWAVTNRGTAMATGVWSETLFIAATNANAPRSLLGTFDFSNALATASFLWRTQQVTLPGDLAAAVSRFGVELDAAQVVAESTETNNTGLADQTTTVPAKLKWQVAQTNIAEDAPQPAVSALITRNGSTTSPLTVMLESSHPTELSTPPSVIIAAGQSSVAFTLTAHADGVLDADKLVTLGASAAGYHSDSTTVTVLNSDLPHLALNVDSASIAEGTTAAVTVSRNGSTNAPVVVSLLALGTSQLLVPEMVTIPAGATSQVFAVLAQDDSLIEAARLVSFQASALGYISASAGLQITDNDLAQFTLTLAATTVSEGAGLEATMATVSRGVASPRSLAVELESSNRGAARVPARVTIPSGQSAVSFPVAAMNDSLTDGPQATQFRAFALASVSEVRVLASAPVTLTVTDDDGPTLTVVPAKDLVGEGLSTATTLAISRNGGTNQSLVVSLTSSAQSEATVPATATFAIEQATVNVPVTTPNDNVSDGSKTVTFTASASGFTSASATLVVSDRNDADLIVTDVNVPAHGESEGFVNVSYRVVNQGFTPAGTNWVTRLLLSKDPLAGDDTVLTDYIFNGTLPVGQFFGQSRQIRLPQEPGDYWIVAVTDTAGQVDEVLEDNNTSVSAQPIHVWPAYQAAVQTALQSAPAGTPVALTGSATKTSTGGPATFALVNIHINVRGTKRIISALTDAAGNFATTFNPLPGEAGLYEIGAAHPGAKTAPVQDSFTLFGVRADSVKPLRLAERSSVTAQIALHNPGDLPLTGMAVTVVSNPPNVQVTASLSGNGTLPGLASNVLGFAITANDGSAGQGTVVFRVTTAEGAALNIAQPVSIDSLLPRLVANPTELIAGMKVGGQAFVEFELINNGGATSAPVHVSVPDVPWMHVVSANPLPPLAPGATNRVALHLTPAANLQLGAYDGWLGINAGNSGITVPFSFRALSEAKGDLRITAVDEYTYFAQGSPKVAGATVTIRDAVTEEPVTNGVTDTNGVFAVSQLQEGYYVIELKADQHTSYRDVILVVAGKENAVQAFLRREAVRYIWTVVPTEIEDRTRITIETVFEAFVPMPVVTIDPPLIDLADFTADVTQIDLKVSNHGLIAAKEAKLNFGSHPDWSFEPLISDLGDLPARSSLTVPLLIRRTGGTATLASFAFQPASFAPAALGAGCNVAGNCRFVIECGGEKLPGSADIAIINASASGNCGGSGGGTPYGGGGTIGGGGANRGGSPAGSSASIRSCDKCLSSIFSCLLDLALPDFASCIKDLAGCASSLTNTSNTIGDDAYACMKGGLNCAVAAGELLPIVGDALDISECIANVSKDCGSPPAGGGGSPPGGGGGSNPLTFAAAAAGGVDTVERAELAILRERAGWVLKEVALLRYMIGSDAWFRDRNPVTSSNWLAQFLQRIEGATLDTRKISATERAQLLVVTLPVTVTTNDAHVFLDRWNRSLDYWAAGITQVSQVPSGQSTNFIAIDVLRGLALEAQEMFAESEAAGFEFPEAGLRQARIDFIRFMSEGDGGGVCAHVRLRLDQQAVVTRDAFAATLVIENESLSQLENIFVDVVVRRRSGEDATAFFGIMPPVLDGITAVDGTGVIGVQSTGKATWTLIPTTDAVLGDSEEFLVSGVLKYRQDTLDISVPLAPALITVFPSASLAVKYFHQRDVFADDPFTTEVEPSVPYSLAVMVQNKGRGAANNVRIASAQPQIVDNEKGLFADFKIIATEVAGQNLTPSLTVELGRIEPGTNAIGRWLMTSTILGGFIDYSAEFEHLDAIGDKHLALIEGVQIHELIHIVRAPGLLDDGRPDFLANDVPDLYDRPDTLHLSDGSVAPVSVVTVAAFDRMPTTGNLIVQMNAALPAGWAYLRVPDPGTNRFRLTRVMRSDGVEVPFGDNVWTTDRTFLGNAKRPLRENTLHLFDRDSTGSYTLYYSNLPVGDANPPASAVAQLPADSTARIAVNWAGQDNAGGSGVQFFDVYVSTDGGPFLHWQHETLDRTGVFQGGFGRTYSFYSIATDQAGNREAAPLTPDAWTTVTRTNRAPTLAPLADVVIEEGETLVVQAQANDLDAEDELTFSLGPNAPAGVTINPYTGLLSWVTSEGTGPSEHTITVQVLDNGLPRLGAMRTFKVTVSDDNSPPVLAPIVNRTVSEGRLLIVTNVAADFDLPAQKLTFSLAAGAPTGANIDPVSGIFRWQPTETQGGTTNVFRVLVQDDGVPSMSVTQRFSVVVRDTQSDFKLSVGTTNLLAGTSITVPLELTSSADLGQMTLDLEASDPHLVNLDLQSLGQEVASASFEPVGGGLFRITVDFDPNQLQTGVRTLARLNLATQPSSHSSIARLDLDAVSASRSGGEAIGKGAGTGGRVFIIENEPLLDTKLANPGSLWLTIYGLPGQRYRLQSSTTLGAGATWQDELTVELTTTFQLVERPVTLMPRFYRVVE